MLHRYFASCIAPSHHVAPRIWRCAVFFAIRIGRKTLKPSSANFLKDKAYMSFAVQRPVDFRAVKDMTSQKGRAEKATAISFSRWRASPWTVCPLGRNGRTN